MATVVFTGPMERALTPDLRQRLQRALQEFPELDGTKITVGVTMNPRLHGTAEAENMLIRLNTSRRRVAYFTIGHELTHLLQKPGLGIVPMGEVQCDIWTLARSELFLDDRPSYLRLPCGKRDWPQHARAVRDLCLEALRHRPHNRHYIVWLESRVRVYFGRAHSRQFVQASDDQRRLPGV
jgi:hypothetical protein